jgi:LysR family nitrogen assimilation transcriptional regulator
LGEDGLATFHPEVQNSPSKKEISGEARLDIRQLKYFVAIIDHKSFTKAANVLRVAQPALGLHIRKLEEELNVELLVRHSRGVMPTSAGSILLDRARSLIEQFEATKCALRDLAPGTGGRVVVGMAPSITAMLAHSLVQTAAVDLPNVSLVLVEELSPVLAEWLASGRLDIAIGYDILQSSNLAGDPLLVEDVFLVQAARKVPRLGETIKMSALPDYELLLPSSPHALRALLDYRAVELGIEFNIRFEMQSVHVIKELVERGVGATILPYGAVHREVAEGRLAAAKIIEPAIRRTAYLVHSARKQQSNAEKSVIRLIRELVKNERRPNSVSWQSASPLIEVPEPSAA